ncbi:MAG: hypothetical protein L0Z55_02355, partial [Planctomycetes bacterium]|nr:hypothetical protein [Planctomycetota bacterium]
MSTWLTGFPLVLEIVPPPLRVGRAGIEEIIERAERIHGALQLSAINVPEIREESSKSEHGARKNPFEPRVEPRVLGRELNSRLGIPAIINHVVVHRGEDALRHWLAETREDYGIRDFVLVGGELSEGAYPGPGVGRANQILRALYPPGDVRIGNIVIPGRVADGMAEAARVLRKIEHGANFFTSQIVYHETDLCDLLSGCAGLPH